MAELALSGSVTLAYVLTNIDGLMVFVALSASGKWKQTSLSFLIAQATVIVAAFATGAFASGLPVHLVGWLGLAPIVLGLYQLRREFSETSGSSPGTNENPLGAAVVFVALSTDTLVLLAAFFADSRETFDHLVLIGALLAVCILLASGSLLSRSLGFSEEAMRKLQRLTPFVMIAAGVYILMDTGTDAL
ncbi:hypothetical protein [Roseibium sediminicola]|uniref:Cadmium resistance transporter (Or sequestration) family protein n=1 Tax=Roseibium sediminicola TaxID=2933272 RepID=A0ABT0GUK0_9HYPH|nr:hypothetical protein [Roseibium sp. CAU 1639]MCK7612971.1 hypothetical protein [Roseibium sp. CAU 1639]